LPIIVQASSKSGASDIVIAIAVFFLTTIAEAAGATLGYQERLIAILRGSSKTLKLAGTRTRRQL
jgi:hypothetical protein